MLFQIFFQNILFSIGSAFLYYVNHFKLYSSFCASHSKAQKVLHPSKYFPASYFKVQKQSSESAASKLNHSKAQKVLLCPNP
jgi:glucan phosphoethanolaminetransferase (alkaline phosphatase superfamily)